jgi:RHS repeat-associated protein
LHLAHRVGFPCVGAGEKDRRSEVDDSVATYTANGQLETLTDAENNKTTYVYDGQDRLYRTLYPSATKGAGTSNSSDYEQNTYDANGNVTALRNRANETTGYAYDALNRLSSVDRQTGEPDDSFAYDLLGRMTSAYHAGGGDMTQYLSWSYDALGRTTSEAGIAGTVSSQYDLAGHRTRITHPDGFYVDQDYLVTGEVTKIRENGATSGVGVLATFGYDDLGRRTSLLRGNGTYTPYTYDAASRLTEMRHDVAPGTTYDLILGFAHNPAGQITQNTRSNDLYASLPTAGTTDAHNGLNQLVTRGSATLGYDSKGNLTSDGTRTFAYRSDNLLKTANTAAGQSTFAYDPLGRLVHTNLQFSRWYAYDGLEPLIEHNGTANPVERRWVWGPGTDEPLVEYDSSGNRSFLHADERGSIVALTDSSGNTIAVNRYDEYGIPASGNAGRFQYTGQAWLPEAGLYYYKARMYDPVLGRFLQPDPVGYKAGMNRYAYVGGDPENAKDPTGTFSAYIEGLVVAEPPESRQASLDPGGHSYDGMGGIGRIAGGRIEARMYELAQAEFQKAMLQLIRDAAGRETGCRTMQNCINVQPHTLLLAKAASGKYQPPRRVPDFDHPKRGKVELIYDIYQLLEFVYKHVPWAKSETVDEFYRGLEQDARAAGDFERAAQIRADRLFFAKHHRLPVGGR